MRQSRRHFSAPQKAQIVRRHISGKEAVSNLADEFGLQPSHLDQAGGRPGQTCFGARGRQATAHREASSEARRAASIQARQQERGHRRADAVARAAKKSNEPTPG
jgi:transposase-like protein